MARITKLPADEDGQEEWSVEVSSAVDPEPEPEILDYPLWSQRDLAWRDVHLGHTTDTTIGAFGCLLTAAAMGITRLLGREVDPFQLNDLFKRNGVFVDEQGRQGHGNLMRFAGIWEVFPEIKGAGYFDYPFPKPADPGVMVPVLDAGGFALVKVDFDPTDRDIDQHWVLVTRHLGEHVFEIHDPWLLPEQQRALSMPPAYGLTRWKAREIIFRISMYRSRADG